MYKTPSNFYICVRGGAPDLCSPLKILFTDWRLIPLSRGSVSYDSCTTADHLVRTSSLSFSFEARCLAVLLAGRLFAGNPHYCYLQPVKDVEVADAAQL
jgi:hypothetical protein